MQSPKDFEEQQHQKMERAKKAQARFEIIVNECMQSNMEQILQELRKVGISESEMKEALQLYKQRFAADIAKGLPDIIKKVKGKSKLKG